MSTKEPVLELRGLQKYFVDNPRLLDRLLRRNRTKIKAVDGVSFSLHENETIGIIGESGCGKTTLLKTILGLNERNDGDIEFRGDPVSNFSRRDWKSYRKNIQIIFQDPFNSLDPTFSVKRILAEQLKIHDMDNRQERIHNILKQVELRPPDEYLNKFPDEMSGGEKQRVSIARALIVEPDIVLADEPVSMLDVSIQASVLNMLSDLIDNYEAAMIYISHDLSTVSYVCDEVNVMYLGQIVERAPTETILAEPMHPYTQELIKAVPIPDPHYDRTRTQLDSETTDPIDLPDGCRFRDRCPEVMDICKEDPPFEEIDDGHHVACHLYE